MKFGKELLRAVAASEPVVNADTWLDYKVLKKMLKQMPPESDSADGVPEAEKIVNSQEEREFFRALSNELKKVETRYTELKSKSLQLAEEFTSNEDISNLRNGELQERLSKCASAHLFVLLVENYAVLNYCGFTKILKKHDKLRSTNTKVRYMAKMVNERNFAKFDDVRNALEKLEASFDRLSKQAASQSAAHANNQASGDSSSASTPTSTYSNGSSHSAQKTIPHQIGTQSTYPAGLDAQRRELEDIHNQGLDRLKSLAATALLSLEEVENKKKKTDECDGQNSGKRVRVT